MAEASGVSEPRSALAQKFALDGRVFVITGGAGLLGPEHALGIAEAGGVPVLADLRLEQAAARAAEVQRSTGVDVPALELDVTSPASCQAALASVLERCGRVDGLINNAARNPKVEDGGLGASRLENFSLETWNSDLAVGLTGAFLMSQVFGAHFARQRRGVIVNIASDLGLIAPDQRIYRQPGLAEDDQPAKPVTYSVVKGGLVMLTKSSSRANTRDPPGGGAGPRSTRANSSLCTSVRSERCTRAPSITRTGSASTWPESSESARAKYRLRSVGWLKIISSARRLAASRLQW